MFFQIYYEKLRAISELNVVEVVNVVFEGNGFCLFFAKRLKKRNRPHLYTGYDVIHSFQDINKSLSAAVHYAGFGKHRQKFRGVG